MSKVLKPYTIIPPNLYIHRDADRQIRNIITDMGRPGYVLVSRQMGKTNLLLNAKRELETDNDVFVYVDLSNPFENARQCFENIIDLAVETNQEKFAEVYKVIIERRRETIDTPAHKQHTSELRMILRAIKGKLVVVLDEIDALTKTNYSDQVFAQIRSIYFSRVNFPELEQLTYILSGVIEPSEIIKDPKISPFNIGQKIFLTDFSKDQFEEFSQKAGLQLSDKVADRIFHWTKGHPRMLWDLSAEIEAEILSGKDISADDVDSVVKNIYLVGFDKPPIDNIREIVKNDREIRNALVDIRGGGKAKISDKVKSKLYLAGISNFEIDEVTIKNEIIAESLSPEWLNSLFADDKELFTRALHLYDVKDYKEAIKFFQRYLEFNDDGVTDMSLCYYYMAYSHYKLSEYEKAINFLNTVRFDVNEEAKLYYSTLHLRGLLNYYVGNFEESLRNMKMVIEGSRSDEVIMRALLNYGAISLKSNNDLYKEDSIQTFEKVINGEGFDSSKVKEGVLDQIKSIAYYNIAQVRRSNGEVEDAKVNLKSALNYPNQDYGPRIALELARLMSGENEQYQLLKSVVQIVGSDGYVIENVDLDNPVKFNYEDFANLVGIVYLKYADLFDIISRQLKLGSIKPLAEQIYEIVVTLVNAKEYILGLEVLGKMYFAFNDTKFEYDDATKYKVLKLLCYLSDGGNKLKIYKKFASAFVRQRVKNVDYLDLENFANLIFILTRQGDYDDALKYSAIINSFQDTVSEEFLGNYLVLRNLELNIYIQKKNTVAIKRVAKEILTLASNDAVKSGKNSLLGETGYDVVKANAESALKTGYDRNQVKIVRRYGRNEIVKVRYQDGVVTSIKYKRVEEDIEKGKCFIINE